MSLVKSGQVVTPTFTVTSPTAGTGLANADSLPTGTVYVNGVADAAVVTVTNITTGKYKAAATLPALSAGDTVEIMISAAVGGVNFAETVWSAIGDTVRLSDSAAQTGDSFARIGAAGAGLTAVGDTAGTTTLLSRITALLQTKAEADTAHGLLATSASLTAAQAALAALIAALNDLSSAEVEALIAAGAGATPATFWQYTGAGGRTLSQSMIAVLSSMIEGSAITITRGDNVSVSITGLGTLAGRTGLWFTAKARPANDTDAQAKIQITEDDGLLRLNGAAAGDPTDGAITVDDEADGDITITLSAEASAQLASGAAWRWDVQVAQPGPGVWTPRSGVFTVQEDVTRATG